MSSDPILISQKTIIIIYSFAAIMSLHGLNLKEITTINTRHFLIWFNSNAKYFEFILNLL